VKRILRIASAAFVLAALTTGCAVNKATATIDPSASFDAIKTVHVVKFDKDGRGIDRLISDNLRARGYKVSQGVEPPGPVDATVTYMDKWMWDITMYMLELSISFREPRTDFPLATGHSLHTSLTRKTPAEMVDEVITNILKEGKTQ
jgi:hypothetical protein